MDLNAAYEHLKEHGYVVFKKVYDADTIKKLIDKYHELLENSYTIEGSTWWFANTLELAPKLMLPLVSHPLLVDFAEKVMGPFVQLDNLTLAGFPSIDKEAAKGRVSGWHRDRWAKMPSGNGYERPLAMNAISYLQDLTDENGPLRVIPGSHIRPVSIDPADIGKPHPDEVVLYPEAGDVVFTHNGLVHSGTPNISGKTRYFFSIYYNMTWLKPTDSHDGPNVRRLIKMAEQRNDRRLLRLLGVDPLLEKRCNSGFMVPDEVRWEQWKDEDAKALLP
jgi:hypothetical protein